MLRIRIVVLLFVSAALAVAILAGCQQKRGFEGKWRVGDGIFYGVVELRPDGSVLEDGTVDPYYRWEKKGPNRAVIVWARDCPYYNFGTGAHAGDTKAEMSLTKDDRLCYTPAGSSTSLGTRIEE